MYNNYTATYRRYKVCDFLSTCMKEKIKKFWQWLRKNVLNKEMLIWIIIAEVIFWSPCIVTGFLAITVSSWWWTAFGAIIVFWSGPFTPAIPLQLALAVALKKLWHVIKNRKNKKRKKDGSVTEEKSDGPVASIPENTTSDDEKKTQEASDNTANDGIEDTDGKNDAETGCETCDGEKKAEENGETATENTADNKNEQGEK